MSAVSASIPSAPIVSIATMGGSAGGRGIPGSAPGTPGGKCCENGRPVSTDPLTGQTICSCQYNPGALLMAAGCYPRGMGVGVPGLGEAASMYSSPYATAAMQGLLPGAPGADPTGFYSSMGALQGTAGYYAYDPFGAYPYGNGRKNATRESTQTLKAWLSEHRKNPYPTKGEKIMLAIITKMTLTQVSTWFANARRRLKKENKMTWSPRNRCGDEDDDLDNDDLDDDADKIAHDDDNDNDTNNNRDFADDQSDNDVDILNCGGGPTDRDSFLRGAGVDFRKVANSHCTMSKRLLSEDCSADIDVLDDGEHDHSDASVKDDKVSNSSLGSAFTLVSPSRVPGINGHHINTTSPNATNSPNSELSHPNKQDSVIERMRTVPQSSPKITSPNVTSQKPKIWSVADVVSNKSSSEDRSIERGSRSPARSPVLHSQINGGHIPHPAFPGPPNHGAPAHSLSMAARGMGLWNPSVVTSLASMAAAGRYHPYSQSMFSGVSSVPSAARTPFPNGGLPAGMVPGLIGSHHSGSAGIGVPHGLMSGSSQPTDLRKNSHLHSVGRSNSKSPEGKTVTSLCSVRYPPSEGAQKSRSSSPITVTAFKPVSRS